MKITKIWLSIVILAVILVTGCAKNPPREGITASDFQLKSLEGTTITLSSLRGRPVLLNFWATWCGPCRDEMPSLERLSQRLAGAGIRHRYEEFDDDHSDIDYRMDVSLPFLYRALR